MGEKIKKELVSSKCSLSIMTRSGSYENLSNIYIPNEDKSYSISINTVLSHISYYGFFSAEEDDTFFQAKLTEKQLFELNRKDNTFIPVSLEIENFNPLRHMTNDRFYSDNEYKSSYFCFKKSIHDFAISLFPFKKRNKLDKIEMAIRNNNRKYIRENKEDLKEFIKYRKATFNTIKSKIQSLKGIRKNIFIAEINEKMKDIIRFKDKKLDKKNSDLKGNINDFRIAFMRLRKEYKETAIPLFGEIEKQNYILVLEAYKGTVLKNKDDFKPIIKGEEDLIFRAYLTEETFFTSVLRHNESHINPTTMVKVKDREINFIKEHNLSLEEEFDIKMKADLKKILNKKEKDNENLLKMLEKDDFRNTFNSSFYNEIRDYIEIVIKNQLEFDLEKARAILDKFSKIAENTDDRDKLNEIRKSFLK